MARYTRDAWHRLFTVICIFRLLYNLQSNLVWFYHDKKTPRDMKQHIATAAHHNKYRSDGIIPCLCWNTIIIIVVTNVNCHCWSVTNSKCVFCCCCCCSYSSLHCVHIFWPCILHHQQLGCPLRLPCLRLFPQLQHLLLALKVEGLDF